VIEVFSSHAKNPIRRFLNKIKQFSLETAGQLRINGSIGEVEAYFNYSTKGTSLVKSKYYHSNPTTILPTILNYI